MSILPTELILEFAKITNDKVQPEQDTSTMVGEIYVDSSGSKYVLLGGTESTGEAIRTPITTLADVKTGDKVRVQIKNHIVTVVGNITSPSASYSDVSDNYEELLSVRGDLSETNNAIESIEKGYATKEEVNIITSDISSEVADVKHDLTLKASSDDLRLEIDRIEEDGVKQVVTTTGFTFNETGLNIRKSNTDINTTITENGMTVKKGNDEVLLTANMNGVDAKDLSANTYLIIGGRSRFENYKSDRTACFWIGG